MPPKPKYKVKQQVLSDFSATIDAKPNLTKEEIFAKFPEFGRDESFLQSAIDYHATAKSGKYKDASTLNAKFPEFEFEGSAAPTPTPEKKKATPSYGGFGDLVFKLASAGAKAQQQQQQTTTTTQQQNPKKNSGPSFAELEQILNESVSLKKELDLVKNGMSPDVAGFMQSGGNPLAGQILNKQKGNRPEDLKAALPGLERKYQWTQQKFKYQNEVLQPEFQKLQSDIGKNFQQYFTKDGIIDTEKVLSKAGELSQQYGGGQNVKELLAQRIREYAQFEQQKPAVNNTFEKAVQKQFGKSARQVLQEAPQEEQEATQLQLQKMWEQAYKQVGQDEVRSKELISQGLGATALGQRIKVGMAIVNGLSNAVASMGEGAASIGINNGFTDYIRSADITATRYELPDPELSLKNILTDPMGTVATRVARQVGTQLPMIAATAVTRSPRIAAAMGWGSETFSLMGETYKEVLENTGNPAEARAQSMKMLQTQMVMLPTYYFQAESILKLGRGAKGIIANTGIETGNDLAQEEVQGVTQATLAGRKFGAEEFFNTAGETLVAGGGTGAVLGGIGKAYKTISEKAPNVQEQHLFGVVQNMGAEGAIKHLENLRSTGQISMKAFEQGVAKAKAMETSINSMKKLNIDEDAQLATVAFDGRLTELTKQLEAEPNASVKAAINGQIAAAKKEIADIQAGSGNYAIVQVNGGGKFAIPMTEVGAFIDTEQDNIAEGTTLVQLKGNDTVTAFSGRLQQLNDMAAKNNNLLSQEQQAEVDEMLKAITEDDNNNTGLRTTEGTATETTAEPVQQDAAATQEQGTETGVQEEATGTGQDGAAGTITVLPRQQAAVEQQRNKEQTFVVGTKKPKTIAYENGERVVLDSSGNKLDPEKETTKQVLRQHAEAYQYDFGETVPDEAWPQTPMGPNDVARFIAENSNNPAEIAAAYQTMELEGKPMSSKQAMIAEAEQQLGTVKVTMDAYAEFGDRNNMNSGIGRFRIDANARSLDQQAQELSWQLGDENGTLITPEDLAEYITDFPMPSTSTRKSKTMAHTTVENRFLELTGIPLTPKVAEIASRQLAQRPTPQQLEAAFDYPADVWAQIIDEEIDNLADYEQYEQQQRQEDVSATDAEQNAGTPGTAGEVEGADTGTETQSDGSGRAPDGSQSPAGGTAGIKLDSIGASTNVAAAEKKAIVDKAKADGTYLKAPNGQPTKLTPDQWATVRTKAFKEWFGDWENDPANASKVVDENGEPMVVYHGATDMTFTDFRLSDNQIMFSPYFSYAERMSRNADSKTLGRVIHVFLNIKNPLLDVDLDFFEQSRDYIDYVEQIKSEGYDGAWSNDNEQISVFSPNQIKSATDNSGAFSKDSNNIKLQLIGNKGAAALDAAEGTTVRMDNLQVAKDMEAAGKDVATIRLATGWEKGVDGMWRYEVMDVDLLPEVESRIAQILGKDIARDFGNVTDVLGDNELTRAYPELSNVSIGAARIGNERGAFIADTKSDSFSGAITFAADMASNIEDVKNILVHEVQHAIQKIEGFSKGGNPSMFTDSTELSADQRLFVEGALAMPQAEALQRLDDMEASEVFSAEEAAQLREAVNAGPEALRALLNGAFDQYQRLAGEVEARNVQARMGMTAEQRRQTPLAATEDVARDRQIVMADTSSPAAFLTTASPAQLEQAGLLDEMIAKAQRALQQILPNVQFQVAETLEEYEAIVRANLQQAGQTDSAFIDRASTGSFGIYIAELNKIVINKAAMKQHDRNTTGVHEVVHPIVTQAVKGDMFTLERLAETILTLQGKGIPGVDAAIDHAFNKGYQGKQTIYDELVTEFLTQVVAGKVDVSKIDKSLIDQVIDVINKVMELLGISYRIQNPGDLQRLSVAVNELFNSGDKTMLEAAIGKFKTAQQPAASLDAIPANQLNQKLRDYAARSLEAGKPKAQVATAIKNATLMSDEEVAAVVDAAERMVGTEQMQQPELPGLEALRETIVDFGREMRKAYKRGRQEGGSEAAQTFREYEQMRTRIRGMITDMLKTARKLGVLKDGDITPELMAGIIRRLTNAKTSAGLLSVYDYLKQVLRDVNYDGKLNRANAMAGRIKNINRSKNYSKNAAVREAVRQFTNINPSKVSDIDAYLATAEKILNTVQGLSASAGVTTAATVRNESPSITLQEIQDYVEQQQKHLLQRAEDALIEQYADYVAMGIIDPAAMTLEEMQEMVNLIDAPTDGRATAEERMAVAEKKLEEMRKAVGYNQMGLDDAYTPGMTDSERKIVDNLRLIDVDKLNAQELAKLNDAINNIIINNDYHGAGEIAQVADAQQDAVAALEAIKKAGMEGKMGDISGKFKQALASKDLLLQFIYRLNKLTSDMQRFIGVHDIMKGYDKAMTLQDKAVKRIDDLKKQLRVKEIDSPLNRYRRGVYADVANNFGGTDAEIQVEFDRRKAWVKATAERLLSSKKPAEQREGELVKQVYDELLEGAATLADVQSKMQPYNMAIVQEWQAIHAERKEYTKEHAEQYNNLMWEDVENYTSTKLKSVDGNKDADAAIDQFDKEFIARGLAHTLAGAKNKKIRSPQPPKGRILNFDFDTVQARAFYETNYDVEVANAIAKFKAILRHPDAEKIFGSTDNKNAVLDNVRATVLQQKGKNPPLNTVGRFAEEFEKQFLRRLQAAGARIALGSITQPLKQYPSVAINTLVNLGKDMPLFGRSIREHFKNQDALNRLYEQFNIGQRGATQAGYNKDVDFAGVDPASFNTGAAKASEVAGKLYDKVNETLLAPLQFADVRVARHSWLAYYMQDLKRQGRDITNINWDAEASAPSNEAAAYAEQMVSRTQNPNDPTSMAALFKERGALKLFVRALMPFSTFSTNMRMRFVNDVEKLTNGTPEAKKEGLQSLVATGVEQIAFNALKVYLIQALIQQPLVEALAKGFGIMDDDEEDDNNYKDPVLNTIWGGQYQSSDDLTKVLSNSVSDYFFSGLGSKVQLTGNYLMNKVYAALVDETYKDGKVSKNPDLYFMPGKLNDALFDPAEWGMYGIAVAKAMEAVQNADEAYGYTDLYYKDNDKSLVASEKIKTKKAPIPDEFQRAYLFIFLVNSLSLAGVGDAELSQINTKLKRKAEKKLEEQYGGREFKIVDEADKEVKRANQ